MKKHSKESLQFRHGFMVHYYLLDKARNNLSLNYSHAFEKNNWKMLTIICFEFVKLKVL